MLIHRAEMTAAIVETEEIVVIVETVVIEGL